MSCQEIEIKLLINPTDSFTDIISHPLVELQHELAVPYASVYYDTPDRLLQIPKITYRVRKEGDVCIATIKTNMAKTSNDTISMRNEWNVEVSSIDPNINCFWDIIPELVTPYLECELVSVVSAYFVRMSRIFIFKGSTIEIAADIGLILANHKTDPVKELELELKAGSTDGLLEYSELLQSELNLTIGLVSKYGRGLNLWND